MYPFRNNQCIGGEEGIRTLDGVAPIPHFECGALDRTMRPLQFALYQYYTGLTLYGNPVAVQRVVHTDRYKRHEHIDDDEQNENCQRRVIPE